ncbi:putative multispanning membrane protein [Piedraia hortae CBS 480.64]|uniref:Transmembrane 9 superfamily member n=1 Tax=Piedraia hortae CBS 480.64 TaxID=1314780 RepID=A0A6A7BSQ9_9PEZI|nr:putative multispanning membrane protein [Piedraia hortae CBS 480.64]
MTADWQFTWVQRLFTLLTFFQLGQSFYIPGWSVKSYVDNEAIPLFVNKVFSDKTQIQYAYAELPFVCPPSGRARAGGLMSGSNVALNLGEVLRGDRIVLSDYELQMGQDDELHYLCSQTVGRAGLQKAIEVVKTGYMAEWIVDNLPGATSFVSASQGRKYYVAGFKMGYEEPSLASEQPKYFLHNHVTLVIRHRPAPGRRGERGQQVVVGFEVYPKSIAAEGRNASGLPPRVGGVQPGLELRETVGHNASSPAVLSIPYTYSVYFRAEEGVEWANRWDLYFENQDDASSIHWLAIINSIVLSGLLTSVVAVILTRTIRGDIRGHKDGEEVRTRKHVPNNNYEKTNLLEQGEGLDLVSDEDLAEDVAGWKLVHTDVFRPPQHGHLLAPLVGSGMQLVCMAAGLVTLSCLGVLNPSFRGGFVSVGVALFVLAGIFSGYFSARLFRTFGGQRWQHNAVVTAALFPGLLFAAIFILNLFVWAQASSTAIPLGTLFALITLWLFIQVPLVYAGSWLGFEWAGAYTHPIKANTVPRQTPVQPWYAGYMRSILLAGLVPFAVIFVELMFVFRSLWQDTSGYYYVFGYLAVVSAILMLAVAETTIIGVYVQLWSEAKQNYHWWWQSFFLGGSSSIWILLYCVYYYAKHLHITGLVSTLLFSAYSLLACLVYGLLTGTVGFLTAYSFVRRIYGAIKVD